MPIALDKQLILELLRELDRKDPRSRVFGSEVHQFRLNPPLPVTEIETFENNNGVLLPEDYKYFMTEIGNGGAGPYYGLFRFGEHDNGDFCKWEDGHLVGDVSLEFQHDQAWNLPASFWDKEPNLESHMSMEEEDRLMEAWDKEMEAHYWNPAIMNGAIPICHQGCALRQWLVIHGRQRGYVWCDQRADEAGIHPLHDEQGGQVTFASWYMSWLRNPLIVR